MDTHISFCLSKLGLILCLIVFGKSYAQNVVVPIESEKSCLLLSTDNQNRLRTIYFGKRLKSTKEHALASSLYDYTDDNIGITNSAYTPSGTWNLNEPAMQVSHADGNTSLELKYVSHSTKQIDENIQLTTIFLKDPIYDFQVSLNYNVFIKQNVFEQWVEIIHHEPKAVKLQKYSSANLYLNDGDFHLTTFHNEWAKEMQPSESKLSRGTKVIESKMGTRTMLLKNSAFVLSASGEAHENSSTVVLGQLSWSGNFKMEYEVDSYDNLRLIAGINPYNSQYENLIT